MPRLGSFAIYKRQRYKRLKIERIKETRKNVLGLMHICGRISPLSGCNCYFTSGHVAVTSEGNGSIRRVSKTFLEQKKSPKNCLVKYPADAGCFRGSSTPHAQLFTLVY